MLDASVSDVQLLKTFTAAAEVKAILGSEDIYAFIPPGHATLA